MRYSLSPDKISREKARNRKISVTQMRERIEQDEKKILERLNATCPGTLMGTLGIRFTEAGPDYIRCIMPVGKPHMRIGGFLHGGATMALIETAGGSGSFMFADTRRESVLGIDISASHLSPGMAGDVLTATARAEHLGHTIHVWRVEVRAQDGRMISVGKVTNVVMPRPNIGEGGA